MWRAAGGGSVAVHPSACDQGTASKILTPTLGIGWMAAPADVAATVCAYRSDTGVRPSPAGQRVLTAFAVSGDLSRHLRRVRRELLARRDLLVGALRVMGLPLRGDQAGAHLVAVVGTVRREPPSHHEYRVCRHDGA